MVHKSVMLEEAVKALDIQDGNIYIDLTLGASGHSYKILNSTENITLICFDLDPININHFKDKLESEGYKASKISKYNLLTKDNKSVYLVNANFESIKTVLEELKIKNTNGILADLGWSTDQLENIEGLSYSKPQELLDMRFDKSSGVKASDLLNALDKTQLEKMFMEYADISYKASNLLARNIIEKRGFSTVNDLLILVESIYPTIKRIDAAYRNKNKFLSQVFQSLRIAVNMEFSNLKTMLNSSIELLNKNCNLVVITFHSGEEKVLIDVTTNLEKFRKVKLVGYGDRPTVEELRDNLSARSAKLWTIQKL